MQHASNKGRVRETDREREATRKRERDMHHASNKGRGGGERE